MDVALYVYYYFYKFNITLCVSILQRIELSLTHVLNNVDAIGS